MVSAYATVVGYPDGTEFNSTTHYKAWDDINNLKGSSSYAICNRTISPLAGKNGTYKRPAPLELKAFNFNIPDGATIEKVVVHYSHRKYTLSSSTAYPAIGAPTITLLNTGKSTTGTAVPTTYTAYTVEFTGVTSTQINSANFGVKIAYPSNTNTNPGRVSLGNVYIEIIYSAPQITVSGSINKKTVINKDTFEVTVNVNKLNNVAFDPNVNIKLSTNLAYVGNPHGSGSLTGSGKNFVWTSQMGALVSKNTLSFTVKANGTGNESIVLTESETNKSYTISINVINYTDTVTTTMKTSGYSTNVTNYYTIAVSTNEPTTSTRVMKIKLPSSTTIENNNRDYLIQNFSATFQTTSSELIITLNLLFSKNQTIYLRAIFASSGFFNQTVLLDNKTVLSTSFSVRNEVLGNLSFTRVLLPEEYKEYLYDGFKYIFSSVVRTYSQNQNYSAENNYQNLRIGVFNSSVENATESLFVDNVIWSESMANKNWTEHKVAFKYNKDNPLYFVFSHEYVGDINYPISAFDFTEPRLVEMEYDDEEIDDSPFLVPLSGLLSNSEYSHVTLQEGERAASVLCYDWNDGGLFDIDALRIQGINCLVDYNITNNVEIGVELSLDDGNKRGYRNLTLTEGSGTASLGSTFDLFGLQPSDFEDLHQIELTLMVNNPYANEVEVELTNLRLNMSYLLIEYMGNGFVVDGERSEDYGIFLNEVDHDYGAKYKSTEYSVPGMDKVLYSRMNIDKKEINIEIIVDVCELENNMPLLDKIVNKFTNKREPLSNRPIPKSIIFDHLPDRVFWYVMEDGIESKIEAGTFTGNIKLTIPDGTAESLTKTTTGSVGQTNGFLTINPEITLTNLIKNEVMIIEEKQGLIFSCYDERIDVGDMIIIDNENRNVVLQKRGSVEGINLNESVDFNSDYFFIQGEYSFNSETSNIISVSYYDRLS